MHGPRLPVDTTIELTRRQREIASLLCSTGLSYKQVADKLASCEGTMRKHTENLYRRIGVNSRAELTVALQSDTQKCVTR